MTVPFLDARITECRTPLWTDTTPADERMVCGAPVLPGRSYCAECRSTLIAGEVRNGRTHWFNRTGGRTMAIAAAVADAVSDDDGPDLDHLEVTTRDARGFSDSPSLGSAEVITYEEVEPEGDRPLLLSDLQDWGMAA